MYWENRGAAVVLIGACCDLEMLGRLERNKGKKFNFLKLKTSNLKEKKSKPKTSSISKILFVFEVPKIRKD